jgi:myo-inositol 2-dehydrogenase / D-chiro-inositol 1-dehydrogenase
MNNHPESESRRKFIGKAAGLGILGTIGAGYLFSSCTPRRPEYKTPVFPDIAPDGPLLRAGLIGCGGRGTGAAINFLNSGPNLQITALGDVFRHRIESCLKSLKEKHDVDVPDQNCFVGFDAYKHVIDSGVDVILCAAPPHFRPLHFEAAIQARKHCFLEKPVAVDPWGARSVMASGKMAESAGLSVVAGTQYRHMRDYVATFGMVKNDAIGDLVSANIYYNTGKLWHVDRQPGWSDMEAMVRDWVNWCWLSGDHIVEQHIHQIDILNWFFEKYPVKATGFGGRHRRPTGDQFDFFSVDYVFDDGRHMHSMCRQINGCANNVGQVLFGTKGYTNCQNQIHDLDGNLIWEYQYPPDSEGPPMSRVTVNPYDQEIINLVTAIRTSTPVNEAENVASSTLVGIMGRESAYTGRDVTWMEMMESAMRLGPTEYVMGPVDIKPEPPVPGTAPGN